MADGGSVPPSGMDCPPARGKLSSRKASSPFSWSAPSPSPAEIAGLERMFPEVVQLPTAAIDRESKDWADSGVIVRPLSRWVPSEAVLREFRRAGLAGRIDTISLAHRILLVKFELPDARNSALLQPWVVNGQPLAVEPWRPDFVPADDALRSALLWIRLPNLPIEYWNEETLRSMLAVAGEFVEADAFTKEKRRGSFARVCARIDLSKPLRPGARIRAHGAPFWQQFMYEHVDCICMSCGSVHLSGSCSSSPEPGTSASVPLFGPWMAALRHRKPSPVSLLAGDLSGKKVAEELLRKESGASLGDREGWRKPSKVSRRRSVPSSSSPTVAVIHSVIEEEEEPCRESHSVPVTVHADSEPSSASLADSGVPLMAADLPGFQRISKGSRRINPPVVQGSKNSNPESVFHFLAKVPASLSELSSGTKADVNTSHIGIQKLVKGKVAVNPFSLIGTDRWAGCPKAREDANPTSLKRARAVEFNGSRLSPKVSKGKGRVASLGKGLSVKDDPPKASGPHQGKDAHETAVISLKEALAVSPSGSRGVGSHPVEHSGVAPMESAQPPNIHTPAECQLSEEGLQVQCHDLGDTSDMIMTGAQGEL